VAEAAIERELAVARQRDLAAGIAAFGDVVLYQGDQAVDLTLAEARRLEVGSWQRKIGPRRGANGGVQGFPPEAILLRSEETSMTTISTYCVSKKPCHNARHVRTAHRPHRLPE
jgi:hypothetical protein